MANRNSFPLIRGRKMRVTRLDGCGVPIYGSSTMVVTDGFVSVAATAQTTEATPIEVINANGKICARDPGEPEFNGYSLDITFCDVQPCTFEMMTGQPPYVDAAGDTIGFKMNTSIEQKQAFALEVWAGVPGEACGTAGAGSYGYILFPFVGSGTIGDFTLENAAVNFVVSGAATKDGNSWGAGPYDVLDDGTGSPDRLPTRLDSDDHLVAIYTTVAPPDATEGCVALVEPPTIAITGVTAGAPGSFQPGNADLPADLAALKAHAAVGDSGSNKPTVAWTSGQYVVLNDRSEAFWDGVAWMNGRTPGAMSATGTSRTSKKR